MSVDDTVSSFKISENWNLHPSILVDSPTELANLNGDGAGNARLIILTFSHQIDGRK
jgi:hypothetical protein